MLWAHRSR